MFLAQPKILEFLEVAKNMENMVATAYEQQGDLLSRYKDDLTRRLDVARTSVDDLDGDE